MNNSVQVFAGGWDQLQHAKLINSDSIAMGTPASVTWKPDGTKFFIIDAVLVDKVLEFSAPTPWSTVGAVETAQFPINPPESNPRGMYWHLDGVTFWIMGTGTDNINQFNLTTPWDLSTASDPGISANPSGLSPNPQGLTFGKGGLKAYIVDSNDDIMDYDMSTPYDLTTFNITPVSSIDISTNTPDPRDTVFRTDGKMMYVISNSLLQVSRYILSIPWDITSAVYIDALVMLPDTNPQGLFIRQNDGKLLFILEADNNMIHTYDMSLNENNSIITRLGEEITTALGEALVYA